MNGQDWQSLNAQYLSSAMDWLRLRLIRLGQAAATQPTQTAVKTVSVATPSSVAFTDRLLGRGGRSSTPEAAAAQAGQASTQATAPEPPPTSTDALIAQAEATMKAL